MSRVIALDYDDTFTLDPEAWHTAMWQLRKAGFTIVGCTFRNRAQLVPDSLFKDVCHSIVYTAGKAKEDAMRKRGYEVAVWIDDNPKWVFNDYAALNPPFGGEGANEPEMLALYEEHTNG